MTSTVRIFSCTDVCVGFIGACVSLTATVPVIVGQAARCGNKCHTPKPSSTGSRSVVVLSGKWITTWSAIGSTRLMAVWLYNSGALTSGSSTISWPARSFNSDTNCSIALVGLCARAIGADAVGLYKTVFWRKPSTDKCPSSRNRVWACGVVSPNNCARKSVGKYWGFSIKLRCTSLMRWARNSGSVCVCACASACTTSTTNRCSNGAAEILWSVDHAVTASTLSAGLACGACHNSNNSANNAILSGCAQQSHS